MKHYFLALAVLIFCVDAAAASETSYDCDEGCDGAEYFKAKTFYKEKNGCTSWYGGKCSFGEFCDALSDDCDYKVVKFSECSEYGAECEEHMPGWAIAIIVLVCVFCCCVLPWCFWYHHEQNKKKPRDTVTTVVIPGATPAQPVVAAAALPTQQFNIQVPKGVSMGATFQAALPDGRTVSVTNSAGEGNTQLISI